MRASRRARLVLWLVVLAGCAQDHGAQGDASVLDGSMTVPWCWRSSYVSMATTNIGVDPLSAACGGAPCIEVGLVADTRCVEGTASCAPCASGAPCISPTPSLAHNSAARTFCSQPCPTHECPTGFTCAVYWTTRLPGGPYCIRDDLFLDGGDCRNDGDCSGGQTCDASTQRCTS